MKITRFGHTSVNISEKLEACHRFYSEVLGLDTTPRSNAALMIDGYWFVAGDTQIHLVDHPFDGARLNPIGPHFAVMVDDIDAAIAELETAKIEFLRIGEGRDAQVWITDPAGNTIELGQDPDR